MKYFGHVVRSRGETAGNDDTNQIFSRINERVSPVHIGAHKTTQCLDDFKNNLKGNRLPPPTQEHVSVFKSLIKAVFDPVILQYKNRD